jgi:hypothetical protein
MRIDNIIKLIGAVIAYSVFISAGFLPYGITLMTSQRNPIIILIGLANIIGWFFGVASVLFLLTARPHARWFLMAYFILGLVGSTVGWIPFTNILIRHIASPSLKMTMIAVINLAVLTLVFILFYKMRRSYNGNTPYAD